MLTNKATTAITRRETFLLVENTKISAKILVNNIF